MTDIHSCSYYCDRPECIKAQRDELRERLAQPEQEPVRVLHKHEWFRTGEMKVGQMRCISCGEWGQEETPQRTWVGLTDEEMFKIWLRVPAETEDRFAFARAIEAAHGIGEKK